MCSHNTFALPYNFRAESDVDVLVSFRPTMRTADGVQWLWRNPGGQAALLSGPVKVPNL
jgi:hypothetical protein